MNKIGVFLALLSVSGAAFAQDYSKNEGIAAVYENVRDKYIDKNVDLSKLSLAVIKGLSDIDRNFRIADDGGRITVYYKARVLRSFLKPENKRDVGAQTKMLGKVMDAAAKASAAVAGKDIELEDILLSSGVSKALDGDSEYYGVEGENSAHKLRNRLNFADRMTDNILYIRLASIHKDSAAKVENSLKEHPEAKALILDLRGNPGGILSEAVKIADLLLDDGIVLSTEDRDGKTKFYTSRDGDALNSKPVVVLVDAATASSAEALAASLQEQSRAKLVGTRTYGKGSIQEIIPLPNGAELGLTTAYFYTPSGSRLHKEGLIPDICTFEMPESKNPHNLINRPKDEDCGRENRAEKELDLNAAEAFLQDKI